MLVACKKNRQKKERQEMNILKTFCSIFLILSITYVHNLFAEEYLQEIQKDDFSVLNNDWTGTFKNKDKKGVMDKMATKANEWQRIEEMRENYNVESSPLYDNPENKEKRNFLAKNLLKYTEAKIVEESERKQNGHKENGDENIALKAKKVLLPRSAFNLSDTKIGFNVKALQGKGDISTENSLFSSRLNFNYLGKISFDLVKRFNSLRMATGTNFDISGSSYETYIDKSITDFIVARISSQQQNDKELFSNDSDKTIEIFFNRPF